MGMIVPVLGMTPGAKRRTRSNKPARVSLADALFTRTQQKILGVLFGNPDRMLHTAEIIRMAKTGSGAAQRELARMNDSGLLSASIAGNSTFYQANRESPVFEELATIVAKTVGLAEPLREALRPLVSSIRAAFVFGSVAKRQDRAQSDIDVMIVSDELTYADVFKRIEPLNEWLGRTVNPTIYTRDEYARRLRENNAFLTRVNAQQKIWLIGGEDDLRV